MVVSNLRLHCRVHHVPHACHFSLEKHGIARRLALTAVLRGIFVRGHPSKPNFVVCLVSGGRSPACRALGLRPKSQTNFVA